MGGSSAEIKEIIFLVLKDMRSEKIIITKSSYLFFESNECMCECHSNCVGSRYVNGPGWSAGRAGLRF